MKAIIFGVTGQDGSHLADLLISKGYQVIGVSRRTSVCNKSRIKHLLNHQSFTIEEGDITDAHSVSNIIAKHNDANEVYNLAAQSFVVTSFKQPGLTWDATAKGCLNILQAIAILNPYARFYQASSSEMFGSSYTYINKNGHSVDLDLITDFGKNIMSNLDIYKFQNENTKFLPQSPYAIAKCAAHYMTRLYREAYGIHASCGILFNHEGPRRGEQFVTRKITGWMGNFMRWLAENGQRLGDLSFHSVENHISLRNSNYTFPKLRLGNIKASRDWGYAGDFCEAMWMMLQQDMPDDYVICTGETHTVQDFLQEAFGLIGVKNWQDYIVIDPDLYRPAEVDYLKGDASKANTVLGWTPKHSFKDLVRLMVECDVD